MIKKPTLRIQEPQPRNIQRADIAPANGYAMVVDGHFKTQFSEEDAANTAASELLANFAGTLRKKENGSPKRAVLHLLADTSAV